MWAFLPKKLPKPPPTFEELAARATVQVAISRTGCFVRNQMRSRLAFFLASGRWRTAERAVLLYFSLPAAISNVILLRGFHDEGVYWSARDCIDDERTDLGWRVGERARRRFRLARREWELLRLLRAFLVWLGHFGAASRDFAEEAEEHSRGPPPKESGWHRSNAISPCSPADGGAVRRSLGEVGLRGCFEPVRCTPFRASPTFPPPSFVETLEGGPLEAVAKEGRGKRDWLGLWPST